MFILLQRQIEKVIIEREKFSSFYSKGSLKKKKNLKTVEREDFS